MKRAGLGLHCSGNLTALGIHCYVVCPQKLDERNKRVKTDGLDAKALCLKLDRLVQGNRDALAVVRVPGEEEERARAFIGSASNWSRCVNNSKRRGAVCWSITVAPGATMVEERAFAQLRCAAMDERAA